MILKKFKYMDEIKENDKFIFKNKNNVNKRED